MEGLAETEVIEGDLEARPPPANELEPAVGEVREVLPKLYVEAVTRGEGYSELSPAVTRSNKVDLLLLLTILLLLLLLLMEGRYGDIVPVE